MTFSIIVFLIIEVNVVQGMASTWSPASLSASSGFSVNRSCVDRMELPPMNGYLSPTLFLLLEFLLANLKDGQNFIIWGRKVEDGNIGPKFRKVWGDLCSGTSHH